MCVAFLAQFECALRVRHISAVIPKTQQLYFKKQRKRGKPDDFFKTADLRSNISSVSRTYELQLFSYHRLKAQNLGILFNFRTSSGGD